MQIIKTYCDICKGLIENEEVYDFSLVNETYEICEHCAEELEQKLGEMENAKISDLPF